MWTLTLPGAIKSPEVAFILLPKLWNNFRMSIQRANGTWHYVAFVELHPNRVGIAHFHVISLCECPGRLKDVAHSAGFGYQAVDTEIEGNEAAEYVSKYTSKQGAQMPKGFRRVRVSRVWPSLPDPIPDPPLLPFEKRETLRAYLQRVHLASREDVRDLLARWQHPEYDI